MPRLSLYRPQKGSDFKFIDRTVYEMFQVGGVDVFIHKYIGPADPSDPNKAMGETTIQDVIFLENRDRKYDADVYTLRGVYNVQDTDFNLSQFGLFLQNDTVFLTVHINNSVDTVGRKIMSGDVVELPNLKDEYALNDFKNALKRFYVVEDVNRAAEGFSSTWYPHLYRLKLKPIMDSQEFKDILNRPEDEDNFAGDFNALRVYYPGEVVRYNGTLYVVKPEVGAAGISEVAPPDQTAWAEYVDTTVRDMMSTYEKEMQINNAILLEAEADANLSGSDTDHFFTLSVDPDTGKMAVNTVDTSLTVDAGLDVSEVMKPPIRDGYNGYLVEDGLPSNGTSISDFVLYTLDGQGNKVFVNYFAGQVVRYNYGLYTAKADTSNTIPGKDYEVWKANGQVDTQFGFGIQFPKNPTINDNYLRTDYFPNRLFRWDGARWVKQEDNVRMTLSNNDTRQTLKTSFINNDKLSGISLLKSDSIDLSKNPPWTAGAGTVDIQIRNNSLYVLTNVTYADDLLVEVWINETDKALEIYNSNDNGKLAFTINDKISNDSRLRWSVYNIVVEQRQSLSKALRKIKPQADN
jgi:hypothetical protein